MDGGAWWATVHGVTKSQTGLSDFTLTFNHPVPSFHVLIRAPSAGLISLSSAHTLHLIQPLHLSPFHNLPLLCLC